MSVQNRRVAGGRAELTTGDTLHGTGCCWGSEQQPSSPPSPTAAPQALIFNN